jgi:hypothetical protein
MGIDASHRLGEVAVLAIGSGGQVEDLSDRSPDLVANGCHELVFSSAQALGFTLDVIELGLVLEVEENGQGLAAPPGEKGK